MDYEERGGVKEFLKSPNHIIVIVNVLIFLVTDLFAPNSVGERIIGRFANFWPSVIDGHEYYRLLTCTFIHFDISHIASNMLLIFLMGDVLEAELGKARYLVLYLSTGILASVASLVYYSKTNQFAICAGASGAGFGLIGAMAALLILTSGRVRGIGIKNIIIYLLLAIYSGASRGGIDNAAHIGGFFAGMLIGFILINTMKRKESPYED